MKGERGWVWDERVDEGGWGWVGGERVGEGGWGLVGGGLVVVEREGGV